MAGVKGRSGGARPGAGRKKKQPVDLTAPAKPAPKPKAKAPAKAAQKTKAKAEKPAPETAKPGPVVIEGLGEEGFDPRPWLERVAQGTFDPSPSQMKALVALMPYVHGKKGEGGKKEQRQEAAEKVASRFAPAAPPRLVATGGKKV